MCNLAFRPVGMPSAQTRSQQMSNLLMRMGTGSIGENIATLLKIGVEGEHG